MTGAEPLSTRAGIRPLPGAAVLFLFVLSGFAGLVYQSLWSHYLGLVLGHAAYAQSLVLAIFMGGMAGGAWLAARMGLRWRRLLRAYALAEAAIGLLGLAFHPLFSGYMQLSEAVLPVLGGGAAGQLYPWLSGALLILPACLLLGATFPLLSAGWLRAAPDQDARVLGGLYFANSLGAAFGALGATFLLLPRLGMPGAMAVAAVVNLVVAAAAGGLAWRHERPVVSSTSTPAHANEVPSRGIAAETSGPTPVATGTAANHAHPGLAHAVLWIALLSGACSFVYEIGWIRLLHQALGTTVHSFELMLAAFLLGLAFGGAWVHRRAARLVDPLRTAALAQVAMGVMAMLSLLAFAHSFDWTAALVQSLARTDGGYRLFLLGSAGIALAVMLPAAFFAGMTLPLFTLALLRAGSGEAAIGRLYAANTVGAIAGVLLMMHVLVPLLSVRGGLLLAATGDVALGFWLLAHARGELSPLRVALLVLGATGALAVSIEWGRPDPRAQLSGAFRTGFARLDPSLEVPFLRDGKTATIGVARSPMHGTVSLLTNGKSDGAMAASVDGPPGGDELTMVSLGALPLALHPQPRQVGVIGWGLGLSTHTLLGSDRVRRVETVEIEPVVHAAGARLFAARIDRALHDPRSRVHFDDARRFYASGRRRYDVIVSEPSNPWVSGVAGLFTAEFYRFLHEHLADDGVLVQWLQTYEIDDALLARIVAALRTQFPDAAVYLAQDNDLVVVACRRRCPAHDAARLRDTAALARETARVGLSSDAALDLRRIGGAALLDTYVRALRAPPHSDFHPVVALQGPRTRFRADRADTLQRLADNGLPVLDLLEGRQPPPASADLPALAGHSLLLGRQRALVLARALREGTHASSLGRRAADLPVAEAPLQALLGLSHGAVADPATWIEAASEVAMATIGHLPAPDLQGAWIAPAWIDPALQPEPVQRVLALYAAAAARDPAAMRASGEAVLQLPQALPMEVQEQALLVAQLGAIGLGDPRDVERLHQGYGVAIPHGPRLRMVRHMARIRALELAEGAAPASRPAPGVAQGAAPAR
ncbi:spermine synthase [Pseudoxanthomonas koreensis]|uniref:spermine/spermidine synthase domain-containing protein n=1 Tax=Pseudoxanthomonas koreensis TaxID=266061 RepID=UPI0013917098|nr:spermine synthase [Pseudoxanthomonas koreensis]KAF1695644.1 spermine synthase [Pseudoxanthomonas koreensis]